MALTLSVIIVWPALDQPWRGSEARVMCSALHAGGTSPILPLPLEGRFACRGMETTMLCSDCKMLSYRKEMSHLKIGLGPKWMQSGLHLQGRCLWAGGSFRESLHSGSLSLAEVSVHSSCNSYYSKTQMLVQIIQQTLLRETCTLKCEWLSPASTKVSGSPIMSSQGEQKHKGTLFLPPALHCRPEDSNSVWAWPSWFRCSCVSSPLWYFLYSRCWASRWDEVEQ